MRKVGLARLFGSIIGAGLFSCTPHSLPSDMRTRTLDVKADSQESEFIVAGICVAQRDLRTVYVRSTDGIKVTVVETETTLRVVRTIKGAELASQIKFIFYDGRGPILIGPPQGPSSPGLAVYFLRRAAGNVYRSAVDVYQPFIPLPWLTSVEKWPQCAVPSECIATLLLTYAETDRAGPFVGSLPINVGSSLGLVGYLRTYSLLERCLSSNNAEVTAGVCNAMSDFFPLEYSMACIAKHDPSGVSKVGNVPDRVTRAARLRAALLEGGDDWVASQIKSRDPQDIRTYLKLLERSADQETRALVPALLRRTHSVK